MMPVIEIVRSGLKPAFAKVEKWINTEKQLIRIEAFHNPPEKKPLVSTPHSFNRMAERTNIIEQYTYTLYHAVVNLLGDKLRISQTNFTPDEKELVIKKLRTEGFNVSKSDFEDIIEVAKIVRNHSSRTYQPDNDNTPKKRPASLNCYDFQRLKAEIKKLTNNIGKAEFEEKCPVLCKIVGEALNGNNPDYLGRHLPFNKITGREAKRYQCLRIMDEILCISNHCISNDEMANLIIKKASELGIIDRNTSSEWTKSISESALKKNFAILSEMISVEHHQDKKVKYDHSVYEDGKKGHLYNKFTNTQRLCAFAFDYTVDEALAIHKEICNIRNKHFEKDYFKAQFPLLYMFENSVEEALKNEGKSNHFNSLTNTDLVTINYKPSELPAIRKKTQQAIELKVPIAIKINKAWQSFIPLAIKQERDKWVLIAQELNSSRIQLITPAILKESFNSIENFQADPTANCFIGISPFSSNLLSVTLELTAEGIESIESEDSAFAPVSPTIKKIRVMPYEKYSRGSTATFDVYINEDFLSELLKLDKNAKLISIAPQEVSDIYEEYFEQRMGRKRVSLEERPVSSKKLKEPKAKTPLSTISSK